MPLSDPLGDMLTRIRNAQKAGMTVCTTPASRLRANVLEVLKREGYIRHYTVDQTNPGGEITIGLKMSQRDLGNHLGLTRETISRSLGDLKARGVMTELYEFPGEAHGFRRQRRHDVRGAVRAAQRVEERHEEDGEERRGQHAAHHARADRVPRSPSSPTCPWPAASAGAW